MIRLHFFIILVLCFLLGTIALCQEILPINTDNHCHYQDLKLPSTIFSMENDPRVESIVNEICSKNNVEKNFKVQGAIIPGIAAVVDENANYLLYSVRYVDQLLRENPRLLYLILAHEIGHFARNHKLDGQFRLREETSADEFMSRALFELKLFNGLNDVLRPIKQEKFAYDYLYKGIERSAIIIKGWKAKDALIKSEKNLGWFENQQNLEGLPLPVFEIKGCPRIRDFKRQAFPNCKKLVDVNDLLISILDRLGYEQRSYYSVPNGFAILTAVEQIDKTGKSLMGGERWQDYPSGEKIDGILDYLSSLVLPKSGYFRLIVIAVTDQNIRNQGGEVNGKDAKAWLANGEYWLPEIIGAKSLTPSHRISVLVYEFEAPKSTKKLGERCEILIGLEQHLEKSGIKNSFN